MFTSHEDVGDWLQLRLGEINMKVRELMTTDVDACRPDTDLAAVGKLMWDHDCGFVPVVDPSGAVVGTITDRDICIAAATRGLAPQHIAAFQAMSGPVLSCMPDDTLTNVLATMNQFKVRRLPVINANGRLEGVVSMTDIVSTMAAICDHARDQAHGRVIQVDKASSRSAGDSHEGLT